jgi:hypothetical protein
MHGLSPRLRLFLGLEMGVRRFFDVLCGRTGFVQPPGLPPAVLREVIHFAFPPVSTFS